MLMRKRHECGVMLKRKKYRGWGDADKEETGRSGGADEEETQRSR